MATYDELTRLSKQEASFEFTGFKARVWQPLKVIPPGTYIHDTYVEFVLGDHYGCYGEVKTRIATTQASPTGTWDWEVFVDVEVFNGHSGATVVNGSVLIASQYGIANTTDYVDVSTSFSGSFYFEVNSTVKWDITETATTVLDLPAYTKYKQYERSTSGQTALCKVIINGTTVQQSSIVSTVQPTTYKFRCDIIEFRKNGALSDVSTLIIQTMTTNGLAVPDYDHNNTVNADFFAKHDGSIVDTKIKGVDDAFGDPKERIIEMDARVALKRKMKSIGKINAFNVSYPNSLTVRITGFDKNPTGYRQITPTGSWEENDTWDVYDISSTLTEGTTTTTVNTGPVDDLPSVYKTEIIGSSLTTNGEDSQYTRLPMRGWQFPGASLSLANEVEITGGSGLTRTYSPTKNFNSYRYLELEIKSNTGNIETDTLTITCQPGTDAKTWPIDVSSTSYVRFRIDLCMPNNKSTTIGTQDTPYPRLGGSTYASQEVQNDAWYGVSRVSQIALTNSNITLNRVYLVADPESAMSNYCFAPTYYVKVENDSNAGNVYLGRRLWQQMVSGGREEEEYDVLSTDGTKSMTTIANFVSRVNNNHIGWNASASTASGSGLAAYKNSTTGYSCWLGGITWRADGTGTIQKDWFQVLQNSGQTDCNVLAQTIFDEFDVSELIPDRTDPFGVWGSPTEPLITIPSYSILRGRATGLLITSAYTGADGEVVNLLLSSDNSNRGNGTGNATGWFNTGSPRALSNKNHKLDYTPASLSSAINPILAGKQYRRAFFVGDLADNPSADKSPYFEGWYSKINGGKVEMYYGDPNNTSWTKYTTNITGVKKCLIRFIHNDNLIGIIFVCEMKSGGIKRYYSTDYGATTVATTISSTGTHPAVCVDALGKEYYFFKDGNDIKRVILDASGTTIQAVGSVVVGNVADTSIGCYERFDDIFLVYKHTSSGITVVRSTDGGVSFS